MNLLFDQNLSPRLAASIADLFPDSRHVQDVGLDRADDAAVWEHAKAQSFCIVSKDGDFTSRSLLQGFPPKVIYLRLGNCPTSIVERVLRKNVALIEEFGRDAEQSCLILTSPAEWRN